MSCTATSCAAVAPELSVIVTVNTAATVSLAARKSRLISLIA